MAPDEHELEDLLRRSRPTPTAGWRSRTERELLPERRPLRVRMPALRLGSALAGGLAVLLLALTLVGVGPFDGGGRDDVRAKPTCRMVTVTRVERTPVLVKGPRGNLHIEHRRTPVRRTVRRCHG